MRHLIRFPRRLSGFTLIELLTVMTIIAILAGLILSISGYANKKAATARAQGEIQALSAACESYKADNGTYPYQPIAVSGTVPAATNVGKSSSNIPSDLLDPRTSGTSSATTGGPYINASLELYEALSGDVSLSGTGGGPLVKNYISDLRQDVLGRANASAAVSSSNTVAYLSDPFGNVYGYSTANATSTTSGTACISGYPNATTGAIYPGYNPTFDLWCTGGNLNNPYNGTGATAPGAPGDPALGWVKNW
jgi:general secretion pathway protein G